jgi:hypothetical protein
MTAFAPSVPKLSIQEKERQKMISGQDILTAIQQLVGWSLVLVEYASVLVCVIYSRRSPWVWLLMAGFLLEAIVGSFYQICSLLLTHGSLRPAVYSRVVLTIGSPAGLMAKLAVLGGVFGVLRDYGTATAREENV